MSAENPISEPFKGVYEDAKSMHPGLIPAAPLILPFNFVKRSIASAFDLGKEGGGKVLDMMKDLGVRTAINTARYSTRFALSAAGLLPIIPTPNGMVNSHQAIAKVKQEMAKTNLPRYYRMAEKSGGATTA